MTWLAISDADRQYFSAPDPQSFLPRGSLVVETRLSPDDRPQTLLAYRERYPWERSLSLQAIPGGGIVLITSQNGESAHVALSLEDSERADLLRITYSWDAPARWGRLAIERPERGSVRTVLALRPRPLWLGDIEAMATSRGLIQLDDDVEFFAFSDTVEPLGPMPSLTANVPLMAQEGYRPVDKLARGDLVETVEHGPVPVLAHVSRTVPARGSFRPVRLRAPYFGLQKDIIVAPDQKLVVSKPMVEYMFGCEAVLVPARHLVNGTSAIWQDLDLTTTYHQLVLPEHETLIAAGSALESLFIGRIRRKPENHAQSLLSKLPRNQLPEHLRSAHPVLRPFEAITLVEQSAA
ncbi:Hint domain-containing protein [Lentibacter sp. XHP0401]|uniref:Hint domain-containing protein n=1 Tax=Lentibacter sp. XHP0401 TaxID=2984334 RepID=UPI0021E8E6EB|nr:Hint domain-containing protein [Lentibacter sp. XHP0401]MCV2893143.1 Hint domain-containing protein [Lentibacter sp. XHP0401]